MFLLTSATIPFMFLTETTPVIYIITLYAVRMFGISMVMMPLTTLGMNSLPRQLMTHGTAVNSTLRQVASSVGTAILISVLTNQTKNALPEKSLLKSSPLEYKELATHATLTGYHAAFLVAVLFGIIGLVTTFFIHENRKNISQSKEVIS